MRVRHLATASAVTLALVLGGCGESEQVTAERSKLELAKVKGDLDQMFLSLSMLRQLGIKGAEGELVTVQEALQAREAMQKALSDHDHETALIAADKLRGLMPEHKEAIRVIRESGQIFWLLSQAQDALKQVAQPMPEAQKASPVAVPSSLTATDRNAWMVKTARQQLHDLGHTIDSNVTVLDAGTKAALKEETDGETVSEATLTKLAEKVSSKRHRSAQMEVMERRFAAVARAREMTEKAKSLDPQFKGAVQLEMMLEKAHSAMVVSAATQIAMHANLAILGTTMIHDIVIKALQNAVSSRHGSVSETWTIMAPHARNAKKGSMDILEPAKALARNLAAYKSGPALQLAEQARELVLAAENGVDRLCEPTGNVIDFRRAGTETAEKFGLMSTKLNAALPNKTEQDEFLAAAQAVVGHEVFRKPETRPIIEKNQKLFDL